MISKYVVGPRSVPGKKGFPYWQAALYKLRKLKNGKQAYQLCHNVGYKRRSTNYAYLDAKQYADRHHYKCVGLGAIRHNLSLENFNKIIKRK